MAKQTAPAPKRVALNMKATPGLRARIEESAKAKGLSIAQEVERTILEAYRQEDELGGPTVAPVVRMLAALMSMSERRTGKCWVDDYATWVAVRTAAGILLNANKPPVPNEEELAEAEGEFADAIAALTPRQVERWRRRTDALPGDLLSQQLHILGTFGLGETAEEQANWQRLEKADHELKRLAAPGREAHETGRRLGAELPTALLSLRQR